MSFSPPHMRLTHFLVLCPAPPPADHGKRPALPSGREHKTVLRPSTAEAVRGERARNSRTRNSLVKPFLDSIVGDGLAGVHDAIPTDKGKQAVALSKLSLVASELEPLDPNEEPYEGIRCQRLRVGL